MVKTIILALCLGSLPVFAAQSSHTTQAGNPIAKSVFVRAYLLANSGRDDLDEDELKQLAADEYRMRLSTCGPTLVCVPADAFFNTRGKRALEYLEAHPEIATQKPPSPTSAATIPQPTHMSPACKASFDNAIPAIVAGARQSLNESSMLNFQYGTNFTYATVPGVPSCLYSGDGYGIIDANSSNLLSPWIGYNADGAALYIAFLKPGPKRKEIVQWLASHGVSFPNTFAFVSIKIAQSNKLYHFSVVGYVDKFGNAMTYTGTLPAVPVDIEKIGRIALQNRALLSARAMRSPAYISIIGSGYYSIKGEAPIAACLEKWSQNDSFDLKGCLNRVASAK